MVNKWTVFGAALAALWATAQTGCVTVHYEERTAPTYRTPVPELRHRCALSVDGLLQTCDGGRTWMRVPQAYDRYYVEPRPMPRYVPQEPTACKYRDPHRLRWFDKKGENSWAECDRYYRELERRYRQGPRFYRQNYDGEEGIPMS